jgi:hypothetical protein
MLELCQQFGPGLVSGFPVSKKMVEGAAKSNHKSPGLGYWKFDGDTRDFDDEFITVERDVKDQEECERWGKIWKVQRDRTMEQNKTRTIKLKGGGLHSHERNVAWHCP